MQRGVLIVPVNTLMQRVCPHSYLHGHALVMKKGQRLSRDDLRAQLDSAGYRHVDQVMEHGEYATRGALLDLYPMGATSRIDWTSSTMRSTACAYSTPTRSARWKKWKPSIYYPPMNSRRTKPLSSCSAASGATSSTLSATLSISISRSAKVRFLPGSNTGSRCSLTSHCPPCSATSRRTR